MQSNRRTGTKPERALASELHRRGLRFRRDVYWTDAAADVRTYIDIAFPRQRVAVFSDGCVWHGCPCRPFSPRANRNYWVGKIARNVARDRRADAALMAAGWSVIRVWEHEHPAVAAGAIEDIVRGR
jgi:DNA mismatch endonuclease (patch repair protein)